MALTKRGSRRIVVDGTAYRWMVRGRPTYMQALVQTTLCFAVQNAECPGTTLVVNTGQPHPSNWFDLPATAVCPRQVATSIQVARAQGWSSEEPGSPFMLDFSASYPSAP